jgi:sucrose-6-phosphate hydrolase SacC (GH32 family)
MNDINGSYWQDGRYHIFYQFNPATPNRGAGFDMHWGHSVSKDLVNWEEWPVALFPDAAGQCYSGTAVMQQQPIPGLNDGVKLPAPALFFAATEPFSQHVATSPDGGRTWKRISRNPVVTNKGDGDLDPKVIWHAASQHYIMVLYVGGPDTYRILRSTDLQHWEETSRLPNWYECPEFIPMKSAVTGEELMLLYGCYRSPRDAEKPFSSNSCYQLGRFDGRTFTPVTPLKNAHLGPNFYAALTFVNEPENRAVMMGWARDTRFPGETFNQCASLPLLMQMKAIHGEDTLCFEPVPEINILRGKPSLQLSDTTASAANPELKALPINAALDIVLRFRPGAAGKFRITLRQIVFEYDAASKTLTRGGQTTTLHPDGPVEVRFVIDRGLVESFWNGGEAAYALSSLPADGGPAFALEGDAAVEALTVFPMSPITLK